MQITSLVFNPDPRIPVISEPGITFTAKPDPTRKLVLRFEIVCRMTPAAPIETKADLLSGIFLTVVHSATQRPITMNLIGDRLIFEDDATERDDSFVAGIRGELDMSSGPRGPFLLHASCHQFVSNVIYVS
jgi:hypothetical protein